jgi:hypothetical protein
MGKKHKRNRQVINYAYGDDDYGYTFVGRRRSAPTYSAYTFTSSIDRSLPRIDELDESTAIDKFEGRRVYVLEKLRGVAVRVIYDGKKFKYGSRYVELKDRADTFGAMDLIEIFEEKYKKLSELIGTEVPFCLYAEMVGHEINKDIEYFDYLDQKEIYFHDIFLNDNWMNWDDFEELMKQTELPIVPKIDLIPFNEEKIKELALQSSLLSEIADQKMEGVVIRPYIEDSDYNRRLILKFTNKQFVKVFPPAQNGFKPSVVNPTTTNVPAITDTTAVTNTLAIVNSAEEQDKDWVKKSQELRATLTADKMLDIFVNDARIIYWKNDLDIAKLDICDQNAYKIVSFLVLSSLQDMESTLEFRASETGLDIGLIAKQIRRELPKRILKSLSINFPIISSIEKENQPF